MIDLKKQTTTILLWQALSMFFRFGSNIVLAWLLTPNAFGEMALVLTYIMGLHMLSDIGVGASIVRSKRGDEPEFYNTARSLTFIRGVVLFAVTLLAAPHFASFYNKTELTHLLYFASLVLLIRSVESIGVQMAIRNHRVKDTAKLELVTQVCSAVITIIIATVEKSAWAMVGGMVIGALIRTLLSYVMFSSYGLRYRFDRSAIKDIVTFGKWVFLSTLFTYLAVQLDRIILGKLISLEQLGIYYIAATLMFIPNEIVNRIAANILYPLYSKIVRSNTGELKEQINKMRLITLSSLCSFIIAIVSISEVFFTIFYKPSYSFASELAPYLAILVWFTFLQGTLDRAILAFGESKYLAFVNAFSLTLKVGLSILGFQHYGVIGFIVGLTLGACTGYLLVVVWLKVKIQIKILNDFIFTLMFLTLTFLHTNNITLPMEISYFFNIVLMNLIGSAPLIYIAYQKYSKKITASLNSGV